MSDKMVGMRALCGDFEKGENVVPILFVTVGLPYSGKMTWAEKMAQTTGANLVVLSSDEIRGELYGDESCQSNPRRVFELMQERMFEALAEGKNVIYDSTALKRGDRRRLLTAIENRKVDCTKIAVCFGVTNEQIRERMTLRARCVPMEVIERMRKGYTVPNELEGWDVVKFYDALG